jgi:hypothetical protein
MSCMHWFTALWAITIGLGKFKDKILFFHYFDVHKFVRTFNDYRQFDPIEVSNYICQDLQRLSSLKYSYLKGEMTSTLFPAILSKIWIRLLSIKNKILKLKLFILKSSVQIENFQICILLEILMNSFNWKSFILFSQRILRFDRFKLYIRTNWNMDLWITN